MTYEATLRTVISDDGVTYLALPDVAALLLDVAATLQDNPAVAAVDALRTMAVRLVGG